MTAACYGSSLAYLLHLHNETVPWNIALLDISARDEAPGVSDLGE